MVTITLQTDLSCNILVLIPKLNADTQGIVLIEVLRKVVESVIYIRVKMAVQFHEVLYVFFALLVKGALNHEDLYGPGSV